MSIEMLNQFTAVEFFRRTAPFMGGRIPCTENHPTIWDQVKLQQEPKWEGLLAAFGVTHGAKSPDELERKMAACGGTKIPAKDILAMAKRIGKDWKWDHVTKPVGLGHLTLKVILINELMLLLCLARLFFSEAFDFTQHH